MERQYFINKADEDEYIELYRDTQPGRLVYFEVPYAPPTLVFRADFNDIEFLLEGIAMNEEISNYGLNHKVGIGVGYGIKKSMEDGLLGDDLLNNSMMITAAAADARMAGVKMPVMSSNGSGNHGITAILPIVAYNKKFPQTDE